MTLVQPRKRGKALPRARRSHFDFLELELENTTTTTSD